MFYQKLGNTGLTSLADKKRLYQWSTGKAPLDNYVQHKDSAEDG